jgi:hypothetical protein
LRYNGYPAADFIGEANPAMLSSAQTMGTMAEFARRVLPNDTTIEWADLSFQEATQGNAALLVFPVSVLLAFLVLAALYESWVLPLAVILIVPMCMLSALAGVKLYGSDNNTFVQPRLQERDPDRRVCARTRIPGQEHRRGRGRDVKPKGEYRLAPSQLLCVVARAEGDVMDRARAHPKAASVR